MSTDHVGMIVRGECPAGCGETLILAEDRRVVCGAEDCRFPNLLAEDLEKGPDENARQGVRLRIASTGPLPHEVHVYIEDQEVVGIEDLRLLLGPDHMNRVEMRVSVEELNVDADTVAKLVDASSARKAVAKLEEARECLSGEDDKEVRPDTAAQRVATAIELLTLRGGEPG